MKKGISLLNCVFVLTLLYGAIEIKAQEETSHAFLTNPLDDSAWVDSEWISAIDAPVVEGKISGTNFRAADGASWFLSEIKNEKSVVSAVWMTTGLGVYDLYVNGQLIGDEVLKPGFTHYEKTKISFTYDITGVICKEKGGSNILSVQSTPGWWADKIITPDGHNGMNGKKVAFRGVLELKYSDGTTRLYPTNTNTWKAGIAGPVTHAAIFDGEEYDARILPGYITPEKLSVTETNTEFQGEIVPTNGAEVYFRYDLSLNPSMAYVYNGSEGRTDKEFGKVKIIREYSDNEEYIIEPGDTLVVDFGQNCAAVPLFEFKASEGTTLICLPSEILNDGNGCKDRGMDGPEGSVYRKNLRLQENGMMLKYTFGANDDYVSFVPRSTFFGYRYISLTTDNRVSIKSIRSIPVSSIDKERETGFITTGNDLVNKLISNTRWSMLSNYLSVPTDCPQRDERLGWTADTQVFCETATYFADVNSFFNKWMRDLRDSQSEKGGFPSVAPYAQYGNETMRLGWADAGVIVPWTMWKQFGNGDIINENWVAMERFIDHVNETKYDHLTLSTENRGWQYADWLSYEPIVENIFDNLNNPDLIDYWNYLSASYWLIDSQMMCDMAKATGRNWEKYEKMTTDAKNYIQTTFLTSDGRFRNDILNDMQTPALFALKNDIVSGKDRENMIEMLRENFLKHGNCLQTGFLGTSILMQTLSDNGMSDIAYELLFQTENPSWLYSVMNGATTIWERWNSYTIEKGMESKSMNSFNHYAYGCVCEWMWKYMAGISSDVSEPGFRHFNLKPIPDTRIGFVKAEYNSASGLIKSCWKYENDKWIWDFTIPAGATASVTIPGDVSSQEYESGSYQIIRNSLNGGSYILAPSDIKIVFDKSKSRIDVFTVFSEKNISWKIFGSHGVCMMKDDIYSFDGYKHSINIESLPSGVYLLTVDGSAYKFIK